MSKSPRKDWSPEAYARFRGFRLRPVIDLLAQVPTTLPQGAVADLGCGAGAAGDALASRFRDRQRIGVDTSPAMLAEARETKHYHTLIAGDLALWTPREKLALIFSNAALNWVPDHVGLLPRLAGFCAPGGVLAVQVPDQQAAPSHRLLRELSADLFPDLFDWRDWAPEVLAPERIERILAPLGRVNVWQTTYYQNLPAGDDAHPVRAFTASTAARPVLSRLSPERAKRFLSAYDAELSAFYPRHADGSVLFPFQRLFFVLETADRSQE